MEPARPVRRRARREGDGKVALVTGAGVRVGLEIAEDLAAHGWTVAAHWNSHRPPRRFEALRADLADPGGPAALAEAFRARFRRLDLLVNGAAVFERRPVEETDAAFFDAQMALNARAPLLLSGLLAPMLRRARGSIVNVADVGGGLVAWSGWATYCASKAALARITECLALELAPEVRVNAVAPGTVLWPEGYSPTLKRELSSRIPLGRAGTPADVAAAVRYLAGAEHVTGVVLPVDGGRSISGKGRG